MLPVLFSQFATAVPVTVPVIVSVPDFGVAAGFALVLLPAPLPDDKDAPAATASTIAPIGGLPASS